MKGLYYILRKHLHGLLEFLFLLVIGIVLVGFIVGSWDLTPTLIFVDIVQNLIVFAWLKGFKERVIVWLKRVVKFIQE